MLENYPIAGHLPFIFSTLIYPLAVSLGIMIYHAANLFRRGLTIEPYTGLYTMAMILLAVLELWFSIFFYKAALDSTYLRAYPSPRGTVIVRWRTIASVEGLNTVTRIIGALAPYYFLAGLALGLSIIPVLLRGVHSRWYVETPLLAAGPLIFAKLEAMPLQDMRFSLGIARLIGADGESVYSFLARERFIGMFLEGVVVGLLLSAGVYAVYRSRRRMLRGASGPYTLLGLSRSLSHR